MGTIVGVENLDFGLMNVESGQPRGPDLLVEL
jgi:hypothetical protein